MFTTDFDYAEVLLVATLISAINLGVERTCRAVMLLFVTVLSVVLYLLLKKQLLLHVLSSDAVQA
jgi:hypothetical protein